MKRKFYDFLQEWRKNKEKECLLVKGARQIGKTYIIEKFGKDNYENYIYLNFFENPELKAVFEGGLTSNEIFRKLSLYRPNTRIKERKTLLFLDEIQDCPNARTALKFLALDERIDVIASGSLLGISYKEVSSIPVGYERQVEMYSMDFEEFLWALGFEEDSVAYVREFFDKKEKVPFQINEKMLEYLRTYMVVGGMPAVVKTFAQKKDFFQAQKEQEKILNSYREDIIKYASVSDKPKIRNCYHSIPKQLAKENTKFQYSVVEKGATARKYGSSVEWLKDANLVYCVNNVSTPLFPLVAYEKPDQYKIYLSDVGLLVGMYGYDMKAMLVNNTLKGPAKGGLYENLVCDMLVKRGYKLNYYKTENDSQEIEFLITKDGEVVPVEVKAGNGASVSLNMFMEKYEPTTAYKLISGNVGVADKKITLPLYMAMFL